MLDITTKSCNIISSILKSLNPEDVATELQKRNLLSAILSILAPLKLAVPIIKKILYWLTVAVGVISTGLGIAEVLLELYNLLCLGAQALAIPAQ